MPTLTPKHHKEAAVQGGLLTGAESRSMMLVAPATTTATPTSSWQAGESSPSQPTKNRQHQHQHQNHQRKQKHQTRLLYLDSLRGILAILVVFHHFRCGFMPCHVFGPSAQWMTDPTVCDDIDTSWNILLNPFFNGPFCVAVFYVMSGTVLAHGLWEAPMDRWRLAVAKRFFRLALPCAAALVWSALLGGFNVHNEAAAITKSLWLSQYNLIRPSPITGMLSQMGWGLWHGTSTLNNAMWTMQFELAGSFLVFVLVALLRASPHRIRRRWLGVLFVALLVPSTTRERGLQAHVAYSAVHRMPGRPGQKIFSKHEPRVVALDPLRHSHLLHQIHESVDTGSNKGTAVLPLSFTEAEPDSWDFKRSEADQHLVVLDKPKPIKSNQGGTLLTTAAVSNTDIVRELLGAADPTNSDFDAPEIEFVKDHTWKTVNPWLWYAAFVAGVGISEHVVSTGLSARSRAGGATPGGYLLTSLAFCCASFPLLPGLEARRHVLWRAMYRVAGWVGVGGVAEFFWYILGAVALMYYLVVHSPIWRERLVAHPVLPFFGTISSSLYLTHLPVIYTLTCWLFVHLEAQFQFEYHFAAGIVSLILSLPVIFAVAYIFWRSVEQPAIAYSNELAIRILGLSSEQSHYALPLYHHLCTASINDGNRASYRICETTFLIE